MDDDEPPGRIPLRRGEWRYLQVADDLERRIRAGEFPYDSALPRRGDLAVDYGVGEMTGAAHARRPRGAGHGAADAERGHCDHLARAQTGHTVTP